MPVRTERARRLPPDERREALITATLPLVLWHGPGVTTRQIAEAADVAEGTIFRVFTDKDALIRAVVQRAFDPSGALRELAAIDRSLDLRARLVATAEVLRRRMERIFTLVASLGLTGPPRDCGPRPAPDGLREAVVDVIGPDRARLRVPPEDFAAALRMLVFSATHPRICEGTPLPAATIVAILLDGMRAPGEEHPC